MSIQDRNTVFYALYPLHPTTDLDALRLQCLNLISTNLDVIWNAESFTLVPAAHPTRPHLKGQVWFDSSLEDEWYVVWLLRKLTASLADLVVRVWDDDGEFLLIEAADEVPAWLTPENSENRVLIYQGHILIVPQPSSPAHIDLFPQTTVSIDQALRCVPHLDPHASAPIDRVISVRLAQFPERSLHRIRTHLPLTLVHALSRSPALVSSLISIYLYSDSREVATVTKAKRLDWSDTCDTNLTLTRCQYAQLYSQRIAGVPAWPSKPAGHVDHLARQLGLKITLGAELALSIAEGDTGTDAEFTKYRRKLEGLGYFRDLLEGSAPYKEQMRKAELFYRSSQEQTSGSAWLANSRSLAALVAQADSAVCEEYRRVQVEESAPDDWMDVMPGEIQRWFVEGRQHDKMQSEGSDKDSRVSSGNVEEVSTSNVAAINSRLQSFIEQVSSHEGAEVPEVNLNPDDFFNALKDYKDQIDRARAAENESESEDTSSIDSDLRAESEEEMREYMRELEEQLEGTTLGESFEKGKDGELDIDFNLVSNILNSFSADSGLEGPASSVLASLGVHLPRNEDDS